LHAETGDYSLSVASGDWRIRGLRRGGGGGDGDNDEGGPPCTYENGRTYI
jgi:hypothetical protein